MVSVVPPFSVIITEEAAAAFAHSAALDPANPPKGIPPTYPFTWFAHPSIREALSVEDGAVPVLIALNIRNAKPLQTQIEYRVSVSISAEVIASGQRLRAGLSIKDANDEDFGEFETVFQMVTLSMGVAS